MSEVGLKKTIANYLFSPPGERKRLSVAKFLKGLVEVMPETVVFGGMPRDFSLGKAKDFCSDLDLVTKHDPQEIEAFIYGFDWKKNKFGGYRVLHNGWMYDLWSLSDTWASRQGYVECRDFSDLLSTTFFDVDAVAFHLSKKGVLCNDGYTRAIGSRTLGINMPSNPSPASMARRAVKYALRDDFAITRELAEYICVNGDSSVYGDIEMSYLNSLKRFVDSGYEDVFIPSIQPDLFGFSYRCSGESSAYKVKNRCTAK